MKPGAGRDIRLETEVERNVLDVAKAERDRRHREEVAHRQFVAGKPDIEIDLATQRLDKWAQPAEYLLHQAQRRAVFDLDAADAGLLRLAAREIAVNCQKRIGAEPV